MKIKVTLLSLFETITAIMAEFLLLISVAGFIASHIDQSTNHWIDSYTAFNLVASVIVKFANKKANKVLENLND